MISVIVATYGDHEWETLARKRAWQSVLKEQAYQCRIFHDPDGTVASSRNDCARKMDGDYLLFVDGDDELSPGYIAAMEAAIERNDERTLFTPAVQTIRNGRQPGPPSFFKEVPLRQANWLVIGTVVHRDLFWEVGGFHDYPHGFEDWALWSKCVRVGAAIVKVPDAVYRYHMNPQSKHRQSWRDRKAQVATHLRIASELDAWEAAHV